MEDREVRRAGDWFRIGFAPVFVDYTKRGTWFIVILLVEVSGLELTSAPLAVPRCAVRSRRMPSSTVACGSCGSLLIGKLQIPIPSLYTPQYIHRCLGGGIARK